MIYDTGNPSSDRGGCLYVEFIFIHRSGVDAVNHVMTVEVSKEELAKLVQGFEKQDILTSSGVTLAGNRYIYLSGTDRVIRAKLGKVGVHCMKTTQAVVVSLYEDPIQPQQAASVVEKLGDYLITCGY
ncbi:hypothetical protein NQ317_001229 [Molorchus minor]|nr:hypothetical protein NQ317_001229 [Molorchus minor]